VSNDTLAKLREAVALCHRLAECVEQGECREDNRTARSLRDLADQLQATIARLESKMRSGE
jgi:hypothetical protein